MGDVLGQLAARADQSEEECLEQIGEPLTPEVAGTALVELVQADVADVAPAYLLTGAGLQKSPCAKPRGEKPGRAMSGSDSNVSLPCS